MSTATATPTREQVVVFRLAAESYAIDIFRVNEIIRMRDITPIPQTRPHLKGLVNLRGKTIPVIDLRVRFGLSEREGDDATRIIVVEGELGNVGLIVDEVREVVTIEAEQTESTPPLVCDIGADYVRGVANRDGHLITLLDLDRTLAL